MQYSQIFQLDPSFVEMRMLLPPFSINLCFTLSSVGPACVSAMNLIVTPVDSGCKRVTVLEEAYVWSSV